MRFLVSGSYAKVLPLAAENPDRWGLIMTPSNNNTPASAAASGLFWAADNGAFSGFDPARFRRFLGRLAGLPRCLFVACPDVVGDARATLARFGEWGAEVAACGQPVAFVGQDGAEALELPWEDFQAWFVGGSTRWKLSQASADLCREAKRRGKHVHIGRVNTLRRMRAAFGMGADSIDGSGLSRRWNKFAGCFGRWMGLAHEPLLFPES